MRCLPIVAALTLAGCFGSSDKSAQTDPATAPSMWVQQAQVQGAQAEATQRETMKYEQVGGTLDYATTVGGRPVTVTFTVEIAAFSIADVPTLDHPIGFVKLDPLSVTTSHAGWEKPVIDTILRRLGSPIQVSFESHSVTAMEGRLVGDGSHATGKAVGTLQVDDRQDDLILNIAVDRPTETTLNVRVLPSELSLADLHLETYLATLAKQLGGKVATTGTLSGVVELKKYEGGPVPVFVRTPVTVQTVAEVVQKIDDEHDDLEVARQSLLRAGLSERSANEFSDASLKRLDAVRAEYKAKLAKARQERPELQDR